MTLRNAINTAKALTKNKCIGAVIYKNEAGFKGWDVYTTRTHRPSTGDVAVRICREKNADDIMIVGDAMEQTTAKELSRVAKMVQEFYMLESIEQAEQFIKYILQKRKK